MNSIHNDIIVYLNSNLSDLPKVTKVYLAMILTKYYQILQPSDIRTLRFLLRDTLPPLLNRYVSNSLVGYVGDLSSYIFEYCIILAKLLIIMSTLTDSFDINNSDIVSRLSKIQPLNLDNIDLTNISPWDISSVLPNFIGTERTLVHDIFINDTRLSSSESLCMGIVYGFDGTKTHVYLYGVELDINFLANKYRIPPAPPANYLINGLRISGHYVYFRDDSFFQGLYAAAMYRNINPDSLYTDFGVYMGNKFVKPNTYTF